MEISGKIASRVAVTRELLASRTVVIANGTSLSGVVELGNARIARIDMPDAWTAADLTLQVGDTAGSLRNLYDAAGTEVAVHADVSRAIAIPMDAMAGAQFIKIRSGTSAVPVNQGADRTLTLTLVP